MKTKFLPEERCRKYHGIDLAVSSTLRFTINGLNLGVLPSEYTFSSLHNITKVVITVLLKMTLSP